jgi:hypothetical protein
LCELALWQVPKHIGHTNGGFVQGTNVGNWPGPDPRRQKLQRPLPLQITLSQQAQAMATTSVPYSDFKKKASTSQRRMAADCYAF